MVCTWHVHVVYRRRIHNEWTRSVKEVEILRFFCEFVNWRKISLLVSRIGMELKKLKLRIEIKSFQLVAASWERSSKRKLMFSFVTREIINFVDCAAYHNIDPLCTLNIRTEFFNKFLYEFITRLRYFPFLFLYLPHPILFVGDFLTGLQNSFIAVEKLNYSNCTIWNFRRRTRVKKYELHRAWFTREINLENWWASYKYVQLHFMTSYFYSERA